LGGFHDAGFSGVEQSVEVCQVSLVEAAEDLLEYLFAGGGAGCERCRAGGVTVLPKILRFNGPL
jgi:hypothetical protein